MRSRIVIVGLAALLLTGIGSVVGLRHGSNHVTAAPAAADPIASPGNSIGGLQEKLRRVPGDYDSWAELGAAYENQGRVTADPTYYPKAEGALRRSLSIHPDDNSIALIGMGALANARHDFAGAAQLARQALKINPYSADAYGVLEDAQTQLGNAAGATSAAQHMLDLKPGLAAYTRASYDFELHGNYAQAEAFMQRALVDAAAAGDIAFCRYQLGELYWQIGKLAQASAQYAAARVADPSSLPPLEGQAKVAAAQGRTSQAIAGYADLVSRYPSPPYLLEYADVLTAAGRTAAAKQQLDLAGAALQLFTANGGTDDLSGAQLAIAQNRPAVAVKAAEREWSRRHFSDVADTLSWALHEAGSDAKALSYARKASALGARNALYLFHLGMIERSLGKNADARRDLRAALALNPHFSLRYAPIAAAALARLGAR